MSQILLTDKGLDVALQNTADAILARALGESLALIGIRSRGVPLAQRIQKLIHKKTSVSPPLGELDITLYRDDLSRLAEHPVIKPTTIDFSIDDKTIWLIDDVLFTGRTVRCALDAVFDLGRPKSIYLAVMVDRGGRELPIQADYVACRYEARAGDNVKVRLLETDGKDLIEVVQTPLPGPLPQGERGIK